MTLSHGERIKEIMMILVLRSFCSTDEDSSVVAAVEMTAENAKILLKRHRMLLNLRKEEAQTRSIVFAAKGDVEFFGGADVIIEALPAAKQEEFEYHQFVVLDSISQHDPMKTTGEEVVVGESGMIFKGWRWGGQLTTVEIPLSTIEEIAAE